MSSPGARSRRLSCRCSTSEVSEPRCLLHSEQTYRRHCCRCADPVSTLVLSVQEVTGFGNTLPPPPLAAPLQSVALQSSAPPRLPRESSRTARASARHCSTAAGSWPQHPRCLPLQQSTCLHWSWTCRYREGGDCSARDLSLPACCLAPAHQHGRSGRSAKGGCQDWGQEHMCLSAGAFCWRLRGTRL